MHLSATTGTFTSILSSISDPALVGAVYKVIPTDITISKTYEFYIYFQNEGGYEYFSTKKTLLVGCTLDATFTDDLTYTPFSALTHIVGNPGTDILTFIEPTFSPTYCNIASHSVVSITNVKNPAASWGTTTSSGVSLAASCSGAQPCTVLDLDSIADI